MKYFQKLKNLKLEKLFLKIKNTPLLKNPRKSLSGPGGNFWNLRMHTMSFGSWSAPYLKIKVPRLATSSVKCHHSTFIIFGQKIESFFVCFTLCRCKYSFEKNNGSHICTLQNVIFHFFRNYLICNSFN